MTYFERPATIAPIFAAFFVVFLPLAAMKLIPNSLDALPYLFLLNAVGLGLTHFFITLTVYFQSANLDYFNSSLTNRLTYFVAPLGILLLFALSEAADVTTSYPVFALWFFGALRFFDFFHVGRQSFGVLQIFRRPLRGGSPPWLRKSENAFFVGMAVMQLVTFAHKGIFRADLLYVTLPVFALGGLFVAIAAATLLSGQRSESGGRPWIPLAYFVMQAVCAASAVYDTRLYLVALAIHYVEYHVIMVPRCFRTALDTGQWVDRGYGRLRRHAPIFYASLLGVVLLFEMRNHVEPTSVTTTFFVHLFDGIFFVHYFVEAFLWKFHKPFYKRTLVPLYFAPEPVGAVQGPTRGSFLFMGIVVGGLFLAWAQGLLGPSADRIRQRIIDPLYVQDQMHWGFTYARQGDWELAQRHLRDALARNANNAQARSALEAVQRNAAERLSPTP